MKTRLYKFIKVLIGWPLSLLALYFICQMIIPQSGHLIESIKHIKYSLLLAGVVSFIIFYFLRSFIWLQLLREYSYHNIPFKQALHLWAISELKRYVPGNIWSILGRAAVFSEKGVNKYDTGRLIIIETQLFIIGCLIISLLSLPFLANYFFSDLPFPLFFITLVNIIIFAASLAFIFNHRIIQKLPNKIKKIAGVVLPSFSPRSITLLIFISSIGLFFFGLGYYFTISSLIFIHPQLILQLIGFFTLSFLLGFLSFLTPAGLGVREWLLTYGLSKFSTLGLGAFTALFARIILVLSEILFILLSILWRKIKSKKLLKLEEWITYHRQETILIGLFLLYTIYFTTTSFLRYDNFYTGRFDLGNMAQTVWNTAHGRIFEFTNPNATDTISRLAFHADFILILFAPFYYIWPNPKILLLLQTGIVGAGAFFVFLIAKDVLKNKNLALTFSFIYLLNPSIQRANLYDFHSVTLVTFLLLGAYYFYRKKKYLYFSLFAILAALTKEEIWLITAFFGILIFFFQKKKVLGSTIFLISTLIFYYLLWHAIPNALGSQHFALSYYSEFGDSPSKIIKTIILSPQKTIGTILQQSRLMYLLQLFLPLGFLSLGTPLLLIAAIPDLTINLLSNNAQLHQIYYQYTSPITPFIFITAIFGVKMLKNRTGLTNTFFIIYLLIVATASAYSFGPLPGAQESNLDMFTRPVDNKIFIEKYLSRLPKTLSVAASNNVGSHLSQRQNIYTVPLGIGKADVIVFLLTDPTSQKAEEKMVGDLKISKIYYLALEKDKFIVFKKKGIL